MKIIYSNHLTNRLKLRNIKYDLPEKILHQSEENYFDNETGHLIAVAKTELYGKTREVMIAYVTEGKSVRLLTIHPLKDGQKENRVNAGRWRKV